MADSVRHDGKGALFQITLELPPNRANQRRAMAAIEGFYKARYIRGCYGSVAEAMQRLKVAGYPCPIPGCVATAHLVIRGTMDCDNLVARIKWPVDALVKSGYLLGDHPPEFWLAHVPTQERAARGARQCVIFEFRLATEEETWSMVRTRRSP